MHAAAADGPTTGPTTGHTTSHPRRDADAVADALANGPGGGPRGLLLVISGPSGVGKTTIARRLVDRFGGRFSVSATTRSRRPGEVDGVDYHFVDEDRFGAMIERGELLEHARVFDRHWYGTPRGPVEQELATGRLIVLDIDVQGALQVRSSLPGACMVFIEPPSPAALLERLRARGREDEQDILRRHAEATSEMDRARACGAYDAFIVNDDLDRATEEAIDLVERRLAG